MYFKGKILNLHPKQQYQLFIDEYKQTYTSLIQHTQYCSYGEYADFALLFA